MARPGDAIAVTGTLGRSAAGLATLEMGREHAGRKGIGARVLDEITSAHLRPTARVAEGRWLAQQPAVHALMDCSDGLATDLGHICRESGVGARVTLDQVPVAPATREAAKALGRDPIEWGAAGGEDYELILTCEPDAAAPLADGLLRSTGTPLTVIGRIEAGSARVVWVDARGETVPISAGYEHFHG